jgi:hypothetical protein
MVHKDHDQEANLNLAQMLNPPQNSHVNVDHPDVVAVTAVLMTDEANLDEKSWHSMEDAFKREIVTNLISQLILQRLSDQEADLSWIEKLLDVAKKLEIRLYHSANNLLE